MKRGQGTCPRSHSKQEHEPTLPPLPSLATALSVPRGGRGTEHGPLCVAAEGTVDREIPQWGAQTKGEAVQKASPSLGDELPRQLPLSPPAPPRPQLLSQEGLGAHEVPENFCFSWEGGETRWRRGLCPALTWASAPGRIHPRLPHRRLPWHHRRPDTEAPGSGR